MCTDGVIITINILNTKDSTYMYIAIVEKQYKQTIQTCNQLVDEDLNWHGTVYVD